MKTRCLRCALACSSFVRSGPGEGDPEGPAVPRRRAGLTLWPEAAVQAAASIAARTSATRRRRGRAGFERMNRPRVPIVARSGGDLGAPTCCGRGEGSALG